MAQSIDLKHDQNGDPYFQIRYEDDTSKETIKWLTPSPTGAYKSKDGKRWDEIRVHYRRALAEMKQ